MSGPFRIHPGQPFPLGPSIQGMGTNFAVYSEHATRVDLCLFSRPEDDLEYLRIPLPRRSGAVWHGHIEGIGTGQLYGIRAVGPFEPELGQRFNAEKILVDPYAKGLVPSGPPRWTDPKDRFADERGFLSAEPPLADPAPKSIVLDTAFDWREDRRPATPWERTLIYECHVRGMTRLHPAVPKELRGTFLGLTTPPILDHLKAMGVTAVELMPVHFHVTEDSLKRLGLVNYWGYNPLSFFALRPDFHRGDAAQGLREFKEMVRRFHAAGLEVILDVVFNHTAEGNHLGPTLSWRGLDDKTYYRLASDGIHYENWTGCGNTLDFGHPAVMRLAMDSLRYWAAEGRVDGFRFDLGATLTRGPDGRCGTSHFLTAIAQDPSLVGLKLIAEPWDLGPGGYIPGAFPPPWAEWNDRFRDTARAFWRHDSMPIGQLTERLAGSEHTFRPSGRGPMASIHYLTSHDGFTLTDLVSFENKHNLANGEENRDGTDNHLSRNWGVEGLTDDPDVLAHRERARMNLMATLAFSLGVPMLRAGDELGHTQKGNNNAYCQDNELSWLHWEMDESKARFLNFLSRVFAMRREMGAFGRHEFLNGEFLDGDRRLRDVHWIGERGLPLTESDWQTPNRRFVAVLLPLLKTAEIRLSNQRVAVLLLLNGSAQPTNMMLPPMPIPGGWVWRLDTARPELEALQVSSSQLRVAENSVSLLDYLAA